MCCYGKNKYTIQLCHTTTISLDDQHQVLNSKFLQSSINRTNTFNHWCKLDFYLATSLVLYSVMPVLVTLGASLAYYHYNCTSCFAPIICQWFFSSKLLFWNCRLAFGYCLWLVTCLVVLGRISELNMYVCQNLTLSYSWQGTWDYSECTSNYIQCDMDMFKINGIYGISHSDLVILNMRLLQPDIRTVQQFRHHILEYTGPL